MSSTQLRSYRATRETSRAKTRSSSGSSSLTVLQRPPERQRVPQDGEHERDCARRRNGCRIAIEEVRDHEDDAGHGDGETQKTSDREAIGGLEQVLLVAVTPAKAMVRARRDEQRR